MVQYIEKLVPFIEDSDLIRTSDETVTLSDIYCPIRFSSTGTVNKRQVKRFQAVRVLPCNVVLVNEGESTLKSIMRGDYGTEISLNVVEYDYSEVASRIEIEDNTASIKINRGSKEQEVVTDAFVNAASNGSEVDETFLKGVTIQESDNYTNLKEWLSKHTEEEIMESSDMFDDLFNDASSGKDLSVRTDEGQDFVYKWLDSYFALPEGAEAIEGGREVVPLLIGPTGVFKSATVKELCKKYDYRLVDLRVAFTSRLDYSGLLQVGYVDDKKYSYSCPMEEIVTCSDGFREYCKRAYDKISGILQDGYIESGKTSDGVESDSSKVPLTPEQIDEMEKLLVKYKEFSKPVVLFLDEITRCFSGGTKVRLLDGRIRSMKELYEEYGEDKPFYVYACDSNGNVKFVPAYSRGITRRNAQMVKVTLDNGAEVICTPDHRWMLRDGSYEQAQYFENGRSLMGTYFGTVKYNQGRFSSEYETYIDPATLKELVTHQEVTKQYDTSGLYGSQDENGDYYQSHHRDLNSRNNVPENLVVLSRKDSEGSVGFGSFEKAKEKSKVYNHKVVKVEWLDIPMDAYDIEVPGLSNFLIDLGDDSGVFVHNCKDKGVEGLLTEMLNQKRLNNMQLRGCKFVAATNLNLISRTDQRHNDLMDELDEVYDVNTDLDVAYSNRFLPLRVQPDDVKGRWFDWAKIVKNTTSGTRQNIHPLVIEFLENNPSMVYNDTPVLDAIEKGLTENETKSQSYPNYRTWDMVSDYLYRVDKDYEQEAKNDPNNAKKVYRGHVISGLLSDWGSKDFFTFLISKGYQEINSIKEVDDEYTDFLESSLDAGIPALMVGPSSMGKTSRVKSYVKKEKNRTGLEPVLINVDLSSKDVVDLMGMPSKVSLLDYVAGDSVKTPGLADELKGIIKNVSANQNYGISDILTVRAPDKDIKDRLLKAKNEGREVIFMFDECNRVTNTSILSAIFEVTSDYRLAGVDFSDMKNQVKVVAACNMSHSEMGDDADYGSAGAVDPALAARFSVFWKKHYDEKDVKSWISFMEQEHKEGKIDGTIIDYFKSLDPADAVEIISKVEKRQLAYAEPSTRNLHQLSMDIKSMRGKSDSESSKLFYGRVIFDDTLRADYGNLIEYSSGATLGSTEFSNDVLRVVSEVLDASDSWEALISRKKVRINGRELYAEDVIDNMKKCKDEINSIILSPLTPESTKKLGVLNRLSMSLLGACNELDDTISQERQSIFETYVGEEFAREFTPFFNSTFGSDNDIDITIEMLSDKSLVRAFFKKYRAQSARLIEEQYEDSMIPLMKDYLKVHGTSLKPDVYAAFISGIKNSLASPDGMDRILQQVDSPLDPLFTEAEKVGDTWILDMLSSIRVSKSDIDDMRNKMSGSSSSNKRRRKSVVL